MLLSRQVLHSSLYHPVYLYLNERNSIVGVNKVTVKVRVRRLTPDAQIPKAAKRGDVAFDLYSMIDHELKPGERFAVPTGIALEIPEGYEGQVRPRSGLALKEGISVLNTPGTIDSGYRGEIKTIIINLGETSFKITKGMRISQLAIRPVPEVQFIEVEELSSTERGGGGFGSTGV
ncbi:MAG: dUTP diphosphatase [Candidatus Thorarchaeota archaeon]|nr:dUTP diphosphatase [Candidatus Thorarchaeota archaeon]